MRFPRPFPPLPPIRVTLFPFLPRGLVRAMFEPSLLNIFRFPCVCRSLSGSRVCCSGSRGCLARWGLPSFESCLFLSGLRGGGVCVGRVLVSCSSVRVVFLWAGGLLITKFRFQKRSSHANGSDCCGAAQHDGSDRSPRSGCLQHLTRRSGASIPLRDPAILSSDRARSSRSNSGSGHVLVVESDARLRAHQRLTARASGRLSARLRATERMVAQLA